MADDGFLPHRFDGPETFAECGLPFSAAAAAQLFLPDDPLYDTQYHYDNTGQTGGTEDADIGLPEAHGMQSGEDFVVVQVIDDGADLGHPDLVNELWRNEGEVPGNGTTAS